MTTANHQPRLGDPAERFDGYYGAEGCEQESYDRGHYLVRAYTCGPTRLLVIFAGGAAQGLICHYDGDLPSMAEMQATALGFCGDGQADEPIERLENGWALIPAGEHRDEAGMYLRDLDQ